MKKTNTTAAMVEQGSQAAKRTVKRSRKAATPKTEEKISFLQEIGEEKEEEVTAATEAAEAFFGKLLQSTNEDDLGILAKLEAKEKLWQTVGLYRFDERLWPIIKLSIRLVKKFGSEDKVLKGCLELKLREWDVKPLWLNLSKRMKDSLFEGNEVPVEDIVCYKKVHKKENKCSYFLTFRKGYKVDTSDEDD